MGAGVRQCRYCSARACAVADAGVAGRELEPGGGSVVEGGGLGWALLIGRVGSGRAGGGVGGRRRWGGRVSAVPGWAAREREGGAGGRAGVRVYVCM